MDILDSPWNSTTGNYVSALCLYDHNDGLDAQQVHNID
jgi:hypothetical protein